MGENEYTREQLNRDRFNRYTEGMTPLDEGGVRIACYVVREYINRFRYGNSAVTEDDYKEAINILVAYAYDKSKNDTKVELHGCDNGCDTCKAFCDGEMHLSLRNTRSCPNYVDDPGE